MGAVINRMRHLVHLSVGCILGYACRLRDDGMAGLAARVSVLTRKYLPQHIHHHRTAQHRTAPHRTARVDICHQPLGFFISHPVTLDLSFCPTRDTRDTQRQAVCPGVVATYKIIPTAPRPNASVKSSSILLMEETKERRTKERTKVQLYST